MEDADEEEEAELLLYRIIMRRARNKKRMAKPKVSQLITFSDPLSLVLAKTFRPPPVMAPEAPSDLPP